MPAQGEAGVAQRSGIPMALPHSGGGVSDIRGVGPPGQLQVLDPHADTSSQPLRDGGPPGLHGGTDHPIARSLARAAEGWLASGPEPWLGRPGSAGPEPYSIEAVAHGLPRPGFECDRLPTSSALQGGRLSLEALARPRLPMAAMQDGSSGCLGSHGAASAAASNAPGRPEPPLGPDASYLRLGTHAELRLPRSQAGCGYPDNAQASVSTSFFHGHVKSFNPKNGYGFVESEQLKAMGLGDAYFRPYGDMAVFLVGDVVTFSSQPNNRGQPQARDILPVKDLPGRVKMISLGENGKGYAFIACASLNARGFGDVWAPKHVLGSLKVGDDVRFSARFNEKNQLQAWSVSPIEPEAAHPDDIPQELTGRIKSFNKEKGFGFIECAYFKERALGDVFLHSSHLGSLVVGDWVHFAVQFNKAGKPQAKDVRPAPEQSAPAATIAPAAGVSDATAADWLAERPKTGAALAGEGFSLREEGWEFVGEAAAAAGVHTAEQVPEEAVGPQTKSSGAAPTVEGYIKSYSSDNGYGFIVIDQPPNLGIGDVFLHKNVVGDFKVLDRVTVSLGFSKAGKPQALSLAAASNRARQVSGVEVPDAAVDLDAQVQSERVGRYMNQQHLCVICQANPVSMVYVDCSHGCICRECSAQSDRDFNRPLDVCPLCRLKGPRKPLYLA